LLAVLKNHPALAAAEIMQALALSHRQSFRRSYLSPALDEGLVEMTAPQSPRSPTQNYRLTPRGVALAQTL